MSFKDRKLAKENLHRFALYNYLEFEPKLEKDFYYRYFLRELLYEIDILEVEGFLDYHFNNCQNQQLFISLLNLKVLPSIDVIIENAQFSYSDGGYFKEINLEDGFVLTEDVIKNQLYEFTTFFHLTLINSLKPDLAARKSIINGFLFKCKELQNNKNPSLLRWVGKPSHLAFFIRQFIDEGYIECPKNSSNEDNLSELSRQIMASFTSDKLLRFNSLKPYVDSNTDLYYNLQENFNEQEYSLPNSGRLG
ncbi:hypothetical protein [Gelidibacter mesophilus]|uniref:hypothetical protein n=1 Tax=Gelidibacter mesophilus TaxID=169050 RepID=UPI0012FA257C|nr:hypothetical protein [Gelidibacter mesophilus]